MKKITPEKKVQHLAQEVGYDDMATDFTVFKLLQYWTQTAHAQ